MNQEPQDKLEVSRDVVEQLNDMVRNSAASSAYGQAPGMTPPGPSPTNPPR
jgi:hypothetical protein